MNVHICCILRYVTHNFRFLIQCYQSQKLQNPNETEQYEKDHSQS